MQTYSEGFSAGFVAVHAAICAGVTLMSGKAEPVREVKGKKDARSSLRKLER